jgi:2'-5' RNA ligase
LVPRANWHVTLAFYGELPEGAAARCLRGLTSCLAHTGPFSVRLAGAGRYRGRVGWVGLTSESDPLEQVMTAAARAWPAPSQPAEPHLTVTRAAHRPAVAAALNELTHYEGPTWQISRVHLVHSDLHAGAGHHPVYRKIGMVRLADPRPVP